MHPDLQERRRMPWLAVRCAALLALVSLAGCAGRGSAENSAVGDAATAFFAAVSSAPQSACELLAPDTLQSLESDTGCADALAEAAPDGSLASTSPTIQVYGREAMVEWADQTLFLSRFDDGWLVTAADCQPRGKDLPYDCSVEGP